MLTFLWNLASFVVALGILVAVHEWGHFWVARRCGVKVQRFSVGFGKPLWRRTDKQGTEFVVAAIPLGGYVKMLDERVEQVSEAERDYAFNRKPVLSRIAIIAAGPGVNFIFAIFALFCMYLIGVQTLKPVIGEVIDNTPLAMAQQQSHIASSQLERAEIIAIGERETPDWAAVNLELISYIGKQSMPVVIQSSGGQRFELQLSIQDWKFDPDKESAIKSIGIKPFRPKATKELALVAENSAAEKIGLLVGDKIVRFDGTPVKNWEQIVELISANPGKTVELGIMRQGREMALTGKVGSREEQGKAEGYLGVIAKAQDWPESYVFTQQFNPWQALIRGIDKTWRYMTLSIEMLVKLITGDVSVKNLSGPISIAQGAGASADYGLVYFLGFLALISVNLGIINLLPLPVLDGGHLMYYLVELFTGRPVSEAAQEVGFKIGAAVLLAIMSIAIVNDIMRL